MRPLDDKICSKVGITPLLAVTYKDVTKPKPDADPYTLAMNLLRERIGEDLSLSDCLAVEDSRAGIVSAV